MNLVVNARDAMPDTGKLTLESRNVILDKPLGRRREDPKPGPHVELTVSDTGGGMDEETQSRVFEPFFTTKELGKGTGLGLSTAYGIVAQAGGRILVESEPGIGSRFRVLLPQVKKAVPAPETLYATATESAKGAATILVVEDEAEVRSYVCDVLRMEGHEVVSAAGGEDALAVLEQLGRRVDLLVTDLVMPGMSGRALATRFRSLHASAAVLFMSGYPANSFHKQKEERTQFLPKPFTPEKLRRAVRAALSRERLTAG